MNLDKLVELIRPLVIHHSYSPNIKQVCNQLIQNWWNTETSVTNMFYVVVKQEQQVKMYCYTDTFKEIIFLYDFLQKVCFLNIDPVIKNEFEQELTTIPKVGFPESHSEFSKREFLDNIKILENQNQAFTFLYSAFFLLKINRAKFNISNPLLNTQLKKYRTVRELIINFEKTIELEAIQFLRNHYTPPTINFFSNLTPETLNHE